MEEIKNKIIDSLNKNGYFALDSRKDFLHKSGDINEWLDTLAVCKKMVINKELDWSVSFEDRKYMFFRYEKK